MGKKKKVTYTYRTEADAKEVRLPRKQAVCAGLGGWAQQVSELPLLLLMHLCTAQASALEDFLFGGAGVGKLLAGGDDAAPSIADLVKRVSALVKAGPQVLESFAPPVSVVRHPVEQHVCSKQ